MYCEKCGRKLEEGEKVCSFCNEKNKAKEKEEVNIDGAKSHKIGLWIALADGISTVLYFLSLLLFTIDALPSFVRTIFSVLNFILYFSSFVLYVLTVVFMGVGLGVSKSKRIYKLSIIVIVFSTIIFSFASRFMPMFF